MSSSGGVLVWGWESSLCATKILVGYSLSVGKVFNEFSPSVGEEFSKFSPSEGLGQ